MAKFERCSGILLHPTSLPGPFGIGEINEAAYRWIDFLVEAKQTVWQILPLGPTGYGNSPYSTSSVFAGNPLLIDIARLAFEGCLDVKVLQNAPRFPDDHVDFNKVINWKLQLLRECYSNFKTNATTTAHDAFEQFCRKYDEMWLDEFATYMAIKNHFSEEAWYNWPIPLRTRQRDALRQIKTELQEQINAEKFIQFQFFKQWYGLKNYANQKGIQIIGDIPIYVNYDSAEVWAAQEMFLLDKKGNPKEVAGVPPDYFSPTGQLWGNPLYDWTRMKKNGYQWWISRIKMMLNTVDIIRIDHFRGFESFWAVPFGAKTAENGKWRKGPGKDFFKTLLKKLGDIPIIVEDLGFITPEVKALRDAFDFPGMKILQFAFGSGPDEDFLPHNYDKHCIVYTGSHDNDTTIGWFQKAAPHEKEYCLAYLGGIHKNIAWDLIRLGSSSTALMSIFPLQDILSLGSEARMNTPGKAEGNWSWRLTGEQLKPAHAQKLAEITHIYGRIPKSKRS
jgi:4-alpha-glucanotransferase